MDNETIKKRLKETTAPPSVIDAVTALIAESERLRASLTSTAELYDDAIRLLRAIMAEHADASASMTEADRWLFVHVEDYQ